MQFYCTFVLVPGARCCVVMLCSLLAPLHATLQLHPPSYSPLTSGSVFDVFGGACCARCLLIQRKASTIFFIAAPNSSLPRCCCCCYCCCSRIPCPGWKLKTKAKQTKAERPYLHSCAATMCMHI